MGHPVITISVGIEITLTMAKALVVPTAVAKMRGDFRFPLILDSCQRIKESQA